MTGLTLVECRQKLLSQGLCFLCIKGTQGYRLIITPRDLTVTTVVKNNIIELYVHRGLVVIVKCIKRVVFLIMVSAM